MTISLRSRDSMTALKGEGHLVSNSPQLLSSGFHIILKSLPKRKGRFSFEQVFASSARNAPLFCDCAGP
jgi:hypothetical protein